MASPTPVHRDVYLGFALSIIKLDRADDEKWGARFLNLALFNRPPHQLEFPRVPILLPEVPFLEQFRQLFVRGDAN